MRGAAGPRATDGRQGVRPPAMSAAPISPLSGVPAAGIATAATVDALRGAVREWRSRGESVALVPTMGGLHAGHLALVAEARRRCRRVVASIFVNPAQFGAGEDLDTYPRDPAGDRARLEALGVDLLFAPSVAEMYGPGFSTEVRVAGVGEGLCADQRPLHFTGVATVVAKLLSQCLPDVALFGEKDYQQLLVVRRLARDLDILVEIVGVPTVREADGLALSSRNAYLSAEGRAVAGRLNRVLADAARRIAGGEEVAGALAGARERLVSAGFDDVDYLELRDAETLAPVEALRCPARLLAAVRVGGCRLIDNLPVAAGADFRVDGGRRRAR